MWGCKAFVRAPENPIIENCQTAANFAIRIERCWAEIIADVQETFRTSEAVPLAALTCIGDAILQHLRKVRRNCINIFALRQQVRAGRPAGALRRVDFEQVATALWIARGDETKSSSVKRSMYDYIGDEPNVEYPGPVFKLMQAYR
jgi:hypothetical protein